MKTPILLLTAVPLFAALVACGDDDNDTDKTRKGVFVDGPVVGLGYETPTHNGLTNAAGEFEYLAGETVTFRLGGITLGSATGAERLSPFDLLGYAPPVTTVAIQAELYQWDVVTNFDRLGNMALLLVALDADANPDNGLDLSGLDTLLATATVDFEYDLYRFYFDQLMPFMTAYDINGYLPAFTTPLTHLYKSLGIDVAGYVETKESSDGENDGVIDSVRYSEYDEFGRRVKVSYDNDGGVDGVIDYMYATTYDANNRQTVSTNEEDYVDGAFRDSNVYTVTYDADGHEIGTVSQSIDDGTVDSQSTTTSTLDAHGNVLTRVSVYDFENDGTTNQSSTVVFTYNAAGRRVTEVRESDSDGNGTINSRDQHVYTYDAAGHVLTDTETYDSDGDGDVDNTYTTTNTYVGALLKSRTNTTANGGGTLTQTRTTTYTHDAAGRQLTATSVLDADGDGSGGVSISTITTTYDSAGRELTREEAADNDGNGTPEARYLSTTTYDASGNVLSYVNETISGTGVVTRRTLQTNTYDANGNCTVSRYESDDDGDVDGNSTPDYVSQSTMEYAPAPHVLLGLLQYFLDD